ALKGESAKTYWYILDMDGTLTPADKFNFKGHEDLKKFYEYEAHGSRVSDEESPHIKLMREQELLDIEPGSDPGNLRWYPKGTMIKRLLESRITDMVLNYGGMEVETPIMYDYNHPNLSKYLNRFPARQYTVMSGEKDKYFLRFAACFGQYLIMHDATVSYRDLPLKLYELTHYSFRREQRGELSGVKRLRAFTMPDMHTFVADMDMAKEEFMNQFMLSKEWMESLEVPFEAGFRYVRSFYEENKEFAHSFVKAFGKPILVQMWDERFFYFIMKFEFNVIDSQDKAVALSTVQIDVENGERFDINYVGSDGKKHHPLFLHTSVSGSIDRDVYALLEEMTHKKKRGEKPIWPLWLSPTQVRLLPISDAHLKFCEEVAKVLEHEKIRVDIDDRNESIGKKIRQAEKDWVPYVAVIGDKEAESGDLAIRVRKTDEQKSMRAKELAATITEKTKGLPFRRLPVPKYLSKQPIFVG
ncbi:MAG: threonine--tRNA ligase, partial [Candidatus Diapherotrites archaeon]|nr:threonine--tRNA ligase [Candidatus Diapherotrites archaeon]